MCKRWLGGARLWHVKLLIRVGIGHGGLPIRIEAYLTVGPL